MQGRNPSTRPLRPLPGSHTGILQKRINLPYQWLMPDFDTLSHEQQLACLAELAARALVHYRLPAHLEITLANLSENATYRLRDRAAGRLWALRVHREGYHSAEAIASELAWLMDLRRQQVVTTPVP